ncbi:hypothetical protein niasHT_036955 [Heterodera trifolii]|uniref:Uncharacterized protein n=1 Tax=Heterodera trifolii TaxID=157864 RepID=A0ABD2IG43_9BILA
MPTLTTPMKNCVEWAQQQRHFWLPNELIYELLHFVRASNFWTRSLLEEHISGAKDALGKYGMNAFSDDDGLVGFEMLELDNTVIIMN